MPHLPDYLERYIECTYGFSRDAYPRPRLTLLLVGLVGLLTSVPGRHHQSLMTTVSNLDHLYIHFVDSSACTWPVTSVDACRQLR